MQVRWTTLAAEDLQRITLRILRDNPTAARRIAKLLYDGANSLNTLHDRGRVGRIIGTRELVSAPFIIEDTLRFYDKIGFKRSGKTFFEIRPK
jgi:plasmid stabilization system protein ParE